MGARGIIDREQERGVCGDSEATWISWGWWGLGSQRAQVTDASDVAAGRLSYGAPGPPPPPNSSCFRLSGRGGGEGEDDREPFRQLQRGADCTLIFRLPPNRRFLARLYVSRSAGNQSHDGLFRVSPRSVRGERKERDGS